MVAQKGKDLLLKLDSTGSGVYVTVAGLRSRTLAFNARAVDATNADSTGAWRELLAGAGIRSASVSGRGVFRDEAADETIRSLFFAATQRNWQIVIPNFGTVTGLFQISALEYAGEHDGEMTYDLSLESAGALSFA